MVPSGLSRKSADGGQGLEWLPLATSMPTPVVKESPVNGTSAAILELLSGS